MHCFPLHFAIFLQSGLRNVTYYPNLLIFLQGYICRIYDISQLFLQSSDTWHSQRSLVHLPCTQKHFLRLLLEWVVQRFLFFSSLAKSNSAYLQGQSVYFVHWVSMMSPSETHLPRLHLFGKSFEMDSFKWKRIKVIM